MDNTIRARDKDMMSMHKVHWKCLSSFFHKWYNICCRWRHKFLSKRHVILININGAYKWWWVRTVADVRLMGELLLRHQLAVIILISTLTNTNCLGGRASKKLSSPSSSPWGPFTNEMCTVISLLPCHR